MDDKTMLPVLAEQNKQFDEIKEMLKKLGQLPRISEENPNENPMYIDFRKIDAFLALQNTYYQMFAQQKVSLEYVPYPVISKSIKWVEKSYQKDLKKQVNKKYKNLVKKEKRVKRVAKIKKFFKDLFSLLISPFKLIFKGIRYLLKKILSLRKKRMDEHHQQSKTTAEAPKTETTAEDAVDNESVIDTSPAEDKSPAVDNNQQS